MLTVVEPPGDPPGNHGAGGKKWASSALGRRAVMMSTMSRSLRILLVEDHADTQLFMSRLLGALQHDVQVAGTLKHARQLAGTCAFDVVISDLGLPDGDGLALIREL